MEFWNRWTLDLDFGPGNAGLWTGISAQKHTPGAIRGSVQSKRSHLGQWLPDMCYINYVCIKL